MWLINNMKIIYIFLLVLILSSSCSAGMNGNVYFEVTKAINGGQVFGIPVLEMEITKTPLLIDLEFRNNFTSPRGKITSFPNHYSSQLEVHIGNKYKSLWWSISLGGEVIYPGNDFGIAPGVNGINTFRVGTAF